MVMMSGQEIGIPIKDAHCPNSMHFRGRTDGEAEASFDEALAYRCFVRRQKLRNVTQRDPYPDLVTSPRKDADLGIRG